ncbi:MAG: flagellar motor protein MotB [Pseudomonadota bacterium]
MAAPNANITVVKRKKVAKGDGHHGGAWKVAYADFVTAMMAFFLLMWLLSATSDEQREGLADYFAPTVPIHRTTGGGDGPFSGESIFSEATKLRDGQGATNARPTDAQAARGDSGFAPDISSDAELADITEVEELMQRRAGESRFGDELLDHIDTRVTDEGLIIDIHDSTRTPIFEPGSAEPTQRLADLIDVVAEVLMLVRNDLAIDGHTDGRPVLRADYSNWELSVDRAHAVRRLLADTDIAETRVARVVGHADRQPVEEGIANPRNRRIVVTVLRVERSERQGASR